MLARSSTWQKYVESMVYCKLLIGKVNSIWANGNPLHVFQIPEFGLVSHSEFWNTNTIIPQFNIFFFFPFFLILDVKDFNSEILIRKMMALALGCSFLFLIKAKTLQQQQKKERKKVKSYEHHKLERFTKTSKWQVRLVKNSVSFHTWSRILV